MWFRGGINYEARIGIVWNVGANEKFWRPLQYHLQAGQGNLHNSDNAPDAIGGGHIQIIRSDRAFALVVLESLESFKRSRRKTRRNCNLHEAERLIECESCNPDSDEIPFDNVLDREMSELPLRDLRKDSD